MLSFKQLSEKKTKIKINPRKEEMMEKMKCNHGEDCDCMKCEKKRRSEDVNDGPDIATEAAKKKDDSYLETDFKKRQKNNEKARKDLMKGPQMKNPHFESTEDAYVSQEEVSEESTEEIAETETFLTFGQYQHALTLDEEQLNEFLKGLFGGGGSKPASSSSGQMPSHAGLASKLGQRRQMMNKLMGKQDTKVLGFSKGGKVKKEEVEDLEETKLGDTAYARARDAGAQRRRTKEYKQGLNRSTTRKEKGMYRLATAHRRTDADLERQKTTYDTGAHKGDFDRAKRAKERKEVKEGRAEDAKKSLDAVKKRQGVLDNYEKKTGTKLDISKTPEHKAHKQNFPGAKRTGKKVKGAKETPLETHNRRVNKYSERLRKYGKTTKQKRDDDAMSKQTSRYD